MSDAIRYFFDEHLPSAVAAGLRRHGIDVLTVNGAGRVGLPDEDQLRFARSVGRVMVTHDQDYLQLAADFLQRGEDHAGVAFADYGSFGQTIGPLLGVLLSLYGVYTATDMLNHVEYL